MIKWIIETAIILSIVSMAVIDGISHIQFVGGYLQWGALGLLAMALVGLFVYLNKLTDIHKKDNQASRREWILISRKNTEAMNNLARCLQDRPCLRQDDRTRMNPNVGDNDENN